jgi:hypothetical protein
MFPFRAGSPLLHQWHIQVLLPAVANRYNQGRIPQPLKVEDLAYCKNHPLSHAARKVSAKLFPRWRGPFLIDSFYPLSLQS